MRGAKVGSECVTRIRIFYTNPLLHDLVQIHQSTEANGVLKR